MNQQTEQDLQEADAMAAEVRRLSYVNQAALNGVKFTPSDHLGNRALRRQAAKNRKNKR